MTSMNPVPDVRLLKSDRLSCFRTEHDFLHYAEFTSPDEFIFFRRWAKQRGLPLLILGGGSNILFKHRKVRSLVLKNKIPRAIREIDGQTIEASSTTMVAAVLAWCQERNLDSFYYLASVPATVGGAAAMNAGRGKKHAQTIYDFVESITVLREDGIHVLMREQIPVGHRNTPFTGVKDDLILSVVFKFQPTTISGSPRLERIQWSKENQDYSAPNCGSVFKQFNPRIIHLMRGKRILSASFSDKTLNWILSHGPSSRPILCLIRLTQFLHRLIGRRAVLELIEVD